MPIDFPQDPNATPEGGCQRFTPYLPPPNLTPRIVHEPHVCPCDQCVWMRLARRMDTTPPLDLSTERDIAEHTHNQCADARVQHTPVTVSPFPRQDMAYPEVYVYPSTSHHITFPVVNYTSKQRAQGTSPWPSCYIAISPQCAKPVDFQAALSPPGSGCITVARLVKTKKTASLSTFKDAEELRNNSIQLEVWDDHVTEVSTGGYHSTDTGEGNKGKKKGKGRD
ncbi:uncharacterized protein GGS22DRAFT_188388 [Annulohypoxylon maeteangense]|uniref:uncharacterized protein n=1 Tax=Annulohypoxylon maeteangense TaxID=1927788 RepID=UPI002008895A|nr:uncharacterized protein GGS22DRAFT_188388 [Annulohypoxylon maeteangense]KAI0885100.1 hypothetical protein GGS22DRAFT_188388 [Annulohypoxylon maeteangense]